MSIVKDFVLLSVLFCLFIYCFYLKIYVEKQKDYFVNILKHDVKIPIVAQKRAFELLSGEYNNELIKNIIETQNNMLDLVNSAISAYDNNFTGIYKYFNLSNFVVETFKSLNLPAESKNMTFYYCIDDNISVFADKINFSKVITYLTLLLIQNSPNSGKIMCSVEIKKNILIIKLCGTSTHKINHTRPLLYKFMPVGHGIKMLFCKKFLLANNSKLKESYNKNIDTFTIEIPLADKNILLKPSDCNNYKNSASCHD